MHKKILHLLFIITLTATQTYAYIDPGTGGYLLSSLWSTIVGFFALILGFLLRFYRYKVKVFFSYMYKERKVLLFSGLAIFLAGTSYAVSLIITPSQDTGVNYHAAQDILQTGVTQYNKEKAFDGYTLFEKGLMDMNGNIVRTWNFSYLPILDNKGYYYAQEGYEMPRWGKFTFDGEPVWIKENMPIHHEILPLDNGSIFVLTKDVHEYKGRDVEFGVIAELDKDGNEISRWSTWDHLKDFQKFHAPLELDKEEGSILPENTKKNLSIWGGEYDYYHLNSFSLVPENSMEKVHRAFTPGNWILSFRHGSMVFILDKDTKEILWSGVYSEIEGQIQGQHAPQMLQNGSILMFDNGRYREQSRVIEVNPVTLKVSWEYSPKNFFTLSQGYVQELPNGNRLITESEKGRIFEITPDKEIVWDYQTPETIIAENEEVAFQIYRAYRYSTEQIQAFENKKWE